MQQQSDIDLCIRNASATQRTKYVELVLGEHIELFWNTFDAQVSRVLIVSTWTNPYHIERDIQLSESTSELQRITSRWSLRLGSISHPNHRR